MLTLSPLHQLFRRATCHTSLHAWRWQERPLHCSRCQSHAVDPWGTYHSRPGCTRSWGKGCKRTCHARTQTLRHPSTRSLPYWRLAPFLVGLSCSSRRSARELGSQSRTR
jgi:hypothetical protein